jgi:hypothetical protein
VRPYAMQPMQAMIEPAMMAMMTAVAEPATM